MKSVVFRAPGNVAVEERPPPQIEEPGDAIVRVRLSAICGHDILSFTGRRAREPGTIGHELVGDVSAVGEAVSRVEVGQRVVSPISVWCGGCFYCKQGLLTACENSRFFGQHLPGAQAELVRVPNADAVLEPLPADLEDEKAILLADVLAGAYAGLRLAGLKAGDSVAVLGCGPTGLSAQLLARAMGASQVSPSTETTIASPPRREPAPPSSTTKARTLRPGFVTPLPAAASTSPSRQSARPRL